MRGGLLRRRLRLYGMAVVEAAAETTLSGLTVKALRALAAERNIEVPNRIRKADLIALIEAA